MPPAASPSVSEKMRLTTSPRPIACSIIPDRPVLEMEHDFLTEPDDVPDAYDDTATLHEIENSLVDLLGVKPAEVAQMLSIETMRHSLHRYERGPLARENDMIGRQVTTDELR